MSHIFLNTRLKSNLSHEMLSCGETKSTIFHLRRVMEVKMEMTFPHSHLCLCPSVQVRLTWFGLGMSGQLSQASPTPSPSRSSWSLFWTRWQLSRKFFRPLLTSQQGILVSLVGLLLSSENIQIPCFMERIIGRLESLAAARTQRRQS